MKYFQGRPSVAGWLLVVGLAAGCGDDGMSTRDAATGDPCEVDADCDDGIFCNGEESCELDGTSGVCIGGSDPCMPSQECNEASAACLSDCGTPDADGDGSEAVSCGGNDCDDSDGNRYPGNEEVCDADDHDEDCDPTTFGVRDADSDGFPDAACCNEDSDGELTCGSDCDDTISAIHPTEAESCDTLDNDCDGTVDEGVVMTFYTDMDMDGRASDDPGAEERMACSAPTGFAAMRGDCNDMNPAVGTGLPELCDGMGVDEDCDGNIDEGSRIDCYSDADDDGYAASGAPLMMVCRDATRTDVGGCPVNFTNLAPSGDDIDCNDSVLAINPAATEACNGMDDDCDGVDDDGFLCPAGSSRGCTTSASCGSLSGSQTCNPSCTAWSPCALPDEGPGVSGTCNGCDDDLDGMTDDNFTCARGSTMPGCTTSCGTSGSRLCNTSCNYDSCTATEECNYCDDDGDGNLRGDELALALGTQTFDFFEPGVDSQVIQGFAAAGAGHLASTTALSTSVVELRRSLPVGYGTITFEAEMAASSINTTPQRGWSAFLYRASGGSSTTPQNASFGAPTNRNGYAVEWAWNGSAQDTVNLVALRASASDLDIESGNPTASSQLNSNNADDQVIRILVTPDNPDTAANETRVDVRAGLLSALSREALCDSANAGEPNCPIRVTPGEDWRFGVGFAEGPSGSIVIGSVPGQTTFVTLANACNVP